MKARGTGRDNVTEEARKENMTGLIDRVWKVLVGKRWNILNENKSSRMAR